jgi:hypothetical protein
VGNAVTALRVPFGVRANLNADRFVCNTGDRGAALSIDIGAANMTGCLFDGNAATLGGAVFVTNGGSLVASRSTFINNTAGMVLCLSLSFILGFPYE